MGENKIPEAILLVDDDPNILSGYLRHLRKGFNVDTALGGRQALDMIHDQGPYAVVVSDLKMPGMDGIELLSQVKERSPDTVRVMLTGFAEVSSAIAAINEGSIFRFLTKPCEIETLGRALADGIKQHRLITAERELLQKTLTGCTKALTDILALLNPTALGRSSRIQDLALGIARQLGLSDLWALQTGALLSQLGMILVPPTALENLYQGKALVGEELQLFDMHPLLAADLLKHIPRLEEVCHIISYQEKRFDGGGPPLESPGGDDIPMGARILKVALDYDLATSRKLPQDKALAEMAKNRAWYDPQVFKALEKLLALGEEALPREVGLKDLTENMVMAEEVHTLDGVLIVPKGFRVTRLLVRLLDNFQEKVGLRLPLKVWEVAEG